MIADIVVGVSHRPDGSRFVVMPVAYAETLCRLACDYWASIPTRKGESRSNSFPIYLTFTANRQAHGEFHERVKRNLLKYENAWQFLREPVERLHDPEGWNLLD